MPKHDKSKDKKNLAALAKGSDLSETESIHLGIKRGENAFVVFRYFDSGYQCFSDWNKEELKSFSEFLRKICQQDWNQIFATGGSAGNKKGLGYTPHSDPKVLPNQNLLDKFSEDTTFFELRVSQKARAHGFRVKAAFFLLWLDKDHEVYPRK